MDEIISYDFTEIDVAVRQEIASTAARLNAALEDLSARIAPLQQVWTREAAEAYRVQQSEWQRSAAALNEILVRLGNAVRDGAGQVADTDRAAANAWR
ncbi:WXG100 family type VII secretion target [Mycolicibacterium mengxianglii]|uniref:WXG100 family type VII secretion target n=1 Tax=Mycolicibacterium mengxianglii TaxID=2736649 RepID=UPI0018EEFF15|nr:WXG100 family type VII secretion target [Mycolicibacterium mengxianglii]